MTINPSVIAEIWKALAPYPNADFAKFVLDDWAKWVPEAALRVRLLIEQAKWGKLSSMMFIERALTTCTSFPWERLVMFPVYAVEMREYLKARAIVGNNPYYGFNQDLSSVASTKYPNLANASITILTKLAGESRLQAYAPQKSKSYADSRSVDRIIDQIESQADSLSPESIQRGKDLMQECRDELNRS